MAAPATLRTLSFPSPSICHTCRRRLLTLQLHQRTASAPSPHQIRTYRTRKEDPKPLQNTSGLKSHDNAHNLPRWAATPSAMAAPFRLRPRNQNDDYSVNEDPEVLRKALAAMLGSDDAVNQLPEALRWLAVTHKSFDHGRRGYNARLTFLGKRFVDMHTSLAVLDQPQKAEVLAAAKEVDAYGREPYTHRALRGLESLSVAERVLERDRLAKLANGYGLHNVIRWKPRQIRDLKASGINVVLEGAIYAVIGAVALQRGGDVALQTVRNRILTPLGVV